MAEADPGERFVTFDISDEKICYEPHAPGTPKEGPTICTEAEVRERTAVFRMAGRVGQNTAPFTCEYQEGGNDCGRHLQLGTDDSLRVSIGRCLFSDPGFISERFPDGLPDGLPTFDELLEIPVDGTR